MKKLISLLLVLLLLVGTLPMALATGEELPKEDRVECSHPDTTTTYEPNNDGTHWTVVTCDTCGEKAASDSLDTCISDGSSARECILCHANIPEEEEVCQHPNVQSATTCKGDGTHVTTTTCPDCTVSVTGEPVACEDKDADDKCDVCGGDMQEAPEVYITCDQDGREVMTKSLAMTFNLVGAQTSDVTWSFSATGSSKPSLSVTAATGTTGAVTVSTGNGNGIAAVTATATWADGQISETFYMSFCDMTAITLQVKDGQKTFRFTETGVFERASGIKSDKVDACSLMQFLTDGCADRVILSENRAANAKVGVITYKTTGIFLQYDPKDENDYSLADLENLSFTALGEGRYLLNFELYERAGGYGYATTKGSLTIVVGDPGVAEKDIVYRTTKGEPVSFDVQDFVDYWEAHADTVDQYLKYVKFEISDRATGLLYLDKSQRGIALSSNKFVVDYKKQPNTYPLDGVTYQPDPKEDSYHEDIDFVAYGDGDAVIRGTVTVYVGEKVPFTDVKDADWFYDAVAYVYENGIMNGTDSKTFSPNATLTRAMVVTMLYRVEGSPAAASTGAFSDVASGAWYEDAVAWAAHNEIVEGVGDGKFAPESPITREQLAAILYRYAKHERMDLSTEDTTLKGFSDEGKVSSYATDAMTWAVHAKIMEGADGKLMPQGKATRAQAAAMLFRFLEAETEEDK